MPTKTRKAPSARAFEAEIATLARGASRLGDHKLVKLCGRALAGSHAARKECRRIIETSRALHRGQDHHKPASLEPKHHRPRSKR